MVDTVENAAFWLPTHFLTDDDLLSDHKPSYLNDNNHDGDDDDEELVAELIRYLTRSSLNQSSSTTTTTEGCWYSTSPQSTLYRSGFSSNGSPTGPSRFPSPPLNPTNKNDAALKLLYEAAAHVARLKLNHHHHNTSTTLSLPRHHLSSLYSHPQLRKHGSSVWQQGSGESTDCYCHHNHQEQHRSYGGGVSGWGPQRGRQQQTHAYTQRRTQEMTAVFLGGPGEKKQSSGTGVFIPRRPDSGIHHNQPEVSTATTRKKGSGCSTVLLPTRVVQALNLNVDLMKNGDNYYNNTTKRTLTHHEILTARRNAVMRRNGRGEGATMVGHQEIGLPTDWTY